MDEETIIKEDLFLEQFSFNIAQLNYRIKRAWALDMTKENQSEYLMAFDSALCLFRAMFLEKLSKNYTFQHYYISIGKKNVVEQIDSYLNTPFDETGKSIREVLKFITDKFICHVDAISSTDLALANAWMSKLRNPCHDTNLMNIISSLNLIMKS